MLDSILSSVSTTVSITLPDLLLCTAVSLVLGVGVALLFMFRNVYTKSFVITLALLPALVQIVILLVNGNLGTGVAVLGAFSLIRFRSVPGSAREIGSIFFAMAIGLATGMGYLAVAGLVFAVVGAAYLLLVAIPFGSARTTEKELKITIPESLEYEGVFDDIFARYTRRADLVQVRTTHMGSLYELHYHIVLRQPSVPKAFLDELRCRNGNLNITCGRVSSLQEQL